LWCKVVESREGIERFQDSEEGGDGRASAGFQIAERLFGNARSRRSLELIEATGQAQAAKTPPQVGLEFLRGSWV
jgi:hypothetical protein